MDDESAARLRAAEECYALAGHGAPGTSAAEAAERAILYVLSGRRSAEDQGALLRDALHDGARTVYRARRSRQGLEAELGYLARAGVAAGGALPVTRGDDVVDRVIARETVARLRQHADALGAPAPRVLAGMLVDETELETATAIGRSRATVTRLRRLLREHAQSSGVLPTAA